MNSIASHSDETTHGGNSVVRELTPAPFVESALKRFANEKHCLLLESSRSTVTSRGEPLGRYSFLTANPVQWLAVNRDEPDSLSRLKDLLSIFRAPKLNGLPPFQGGVAGVLGYELNRALEHLPQIRENDFNFPAFAVGLYDTVIAWDHEQDRAWIVSHGLKPDGTACQQLAAERVGQFQSILQRDVTSQSFETPVPAKLTHTTYPTPFGSPQLVSNFAHESYIRAIERAIEYIVAGDVFQVNIAQQLLHPANCHASQLYRRLRKRNPAPFGGYLDLGDSQVVSASPERLVQLNEGRVETRPIKGTRKRTRFPQVDMHSQKKLLASEKDRSENIMIVDLMRNDLSRVCKDDSIMVSQLCEVEEYESVLHLVSAVKGELCRNCDAIDLLTAIFPGGSITGAPKIRAMEIINELEPSPRGAYCGSLGYIGFDGAIDFNILIRTITANNGWWQIPVGGGIVSQSDPEKEYEETWTKAAGMLRAIEP